MVRKQGEEHLHGLKKCIRSALVFQPGSAGFSVGSCVIWDFQTKNITRVLSDKNYIAATTSICWSKNDLWLLVSDVERSLILWDAVNGNIVARSTLQHIPMQVHLHPGSTTPSVCLVCSVSSAPLVVDLKTGNTTVLPIALSDGKKKSGGFIPVIPTAACFNKCGDLVYVGNYKGEILVIDHESINIRAIIPVPGDAMIKNIEFSRNGKYLHTNSTDGILRIYKNLLPIKDALLALNDATCGQAAKKYEAKNLKVTGSMCLNLLQDFPNSTEVHWKASCVSHDGKWVAAASTSLDYGICVWDKTGRIVKFIDGPKEMLIDITWHPVHPVVLAISRTGSVYTWGDDHTGDLTACSPKVQMLEQMAREERANEFDSLPETEIATSQPRSPHFKKTGKNDYPKNLAVGSLEEVGRLTYLRKKRKVSKPEADNVMNPPST